MTFTGRGLYASSSKEPRRRRGRWLWVGLGSIVALLALAVGALTAIENVEVGGDSSSQAFEDAPERVVVENRTQGEVSVVGSSTDTVTVNVETSGSPVGGVAESMDREGDTVAVEAECEGALGWNCSAHYELAVPEGIEVEVVSVSGEISAADLSGPVDLESESGEIEGFDLSGDDVRARSISGEIDLEGLDVATVEAETTSGETLVSGGFDTARVTSVSGEVFVEAEREFDRLTAESTSGDVQMAVPDAVYKVDAESTSGEIGTEVEVSESADAPLIEAVSVSGAIDVVV